MASSRTASFLLIAMVALAIGLGACGRRGALEPPPNAPAPSPRVEGEPVNSAPQSTNADRPFILDRLL